MAARFIRIAQALSVSAESYVQQVDLALQALGPIGLQSLVVTRREGDNRRVPRLETTISYVTPGPVDFRAIAFSSTQGQDPDVIAAALFANNPSARVHFIRDVSSDHRGSLDNNIIMLIYAETVMPNCGYDRSKVVIVEALAPILAGASGNAEIVSASGLAGQVISIVNRFDSTWNAGARGYATTRLGSCIWDGYKTCC